MQADLIVRNATLPEGRAGLDVISADGLIQAIGPGIEATADEEVDAGGRLIAPPFVD